MNPSETGTDWSRERQKLIKKIIESKTEHQQCLLQLKKKSQEYDSMILEKLNMEKQHKEQINDIFTQLNALQIETENLKTQYSKEATENATIVHQNQMHLKEKSQECDLLVSEKIKMEKLHSQRVNSMSSELNALQIETSNVKSQYSKKESENITLVHENQTLKARIKQLQAIQQQTTSASEANQMDSKNQPDTYEMEKIIDHKKRKDGLHFRVRWKNYSANDDTWEPESSLMCSLCEYKKKMHLN